MNRLCLSAILLLHSTYIINHTELTLKHIEYIILSCAVFLLVIINDPLLFVGEIKGAFIREEMSANTRAHVNYALKMTYIKYFSLG